MNINSMTQNSLINSYFSSMNKNKNILFGANSKKNPTELDYASINSMKLEKVLSRRAEKEAAAAKEMVTYRDTTKEFYGDFYPKMNDLASAASKLKSTTMDSVLKPMGYGSDNSKVAANVSGTIESGANVSLEVSQLATAQKNTFSGVSATAKDLVGKSTFSFEIDGKKSSISVDIAEGTTNEAALKQVAEKLNSAKNGVTASVSVTDGKAQLSLASTKTGEKSAFGVEVTGVAAKPLGEATITAAQNAKYKVDGKEFTSESNTVKVADGKLNATLTGTGTASLGKKNIDTGNALYAVKDFAAKYNDVVDFLNKNSSKSLGIKNMASSFGDTKYISNALSKVGLSTDSSGKLYVDDKQFNIAMEKDPELVNRIIGSAGGLAGETSQKARSAIANSTRLFEPPKAFNRFYGTPVGVLMDMRA